ncbi:putative glycosyltransferase EpsE [compost metagenome]
MLSASVVVSCYKQEDYIVECLDSILSQTIDFECEIIVSDDCSPDRTQEILLEYNKRVGSKLKLLLRDKNVGAAMNYHGVHAMATGDIVFHFDGDDVMLPGKLQKQYDVFKNFPDVNVVFHKATYFSDDRSYVSETVYPGEGKPNCFFFGLSELSRWGAVAVHSSYAYRRSSRKAKIEREFMEWFFAMDSLIPGGRCAFLNESFVLYRCNPSAGSYLSTKSGKNKSYTIFLNDLYGYFERQPLLRTDLYANFLVTFLAMLKSTRTTSLKSIGFLLKNAIYFRLAKFTDAINTRKLVGPGKRIR